MEEILDRLKYEKHRKSTKGVYLNVWQNFNKFLIRLDSMPKSWEHRVSLYCSYLIEVKEVQSQTVKTYVSAIKSVLTNDGYEWDSKLILLNTLTRSCKLKNDCLKVRLPIRRSLLELILLDIENRYNRNSLQPYLTALYQIAFLLAYYGLMRVGELACSPHVIKAKNLHICRRSNKLLILLYSSKTHGSESRPQEIRIKGSSALEVADKNRTFCLENSARKSELTKYCCPIETARRYAKLRPRRVRESEQFLIFRDGSEVRPHHLRDVLRVSLDNLNLDSKLYDTHSFRIGRATDLFNWGHSIDLIKHLGRWKSNAVYKYLRP